jgi:hypothetical protein
MPFGGTYSLPDCPIVGEVTLPQATANQATLAAIHCTAEDLPMRLVMSRPRQFA